MLNVIEYGKDEYSFPSLLVLGCFDAIHLGHRELFKKAKLQAKINGLDLGVMVFKDGKGGKLVYSFEERLAMLEEYNVKFVLAIDYTDDFKKITAVDFLKGIEEKVNVKAYMSGKDFRFGAGAKGKASTLKSFAEDEENGVWYMPIKDVTLGNEKISTTLIKSCLDEGDVKKANALLGESFYVEGEVVKGAGRGSSVLGFPTVNIVYPEYKYEIKKGVYAVKCKVEEREYVGIANFGDRPTFDDGEVTLEAYLSGFDGDLYGKTVKVEFTDYLRDIKKFESAEELKAQLQADLQSVLSPAEETASPAQAEQTAEPDQPAAPEQSAEPEQTAEPEQ